MGIKETKSELKKVIWPSKKDVAFGTAAVIAISAIVGAFIFLADTASLTAVDFIISRF
jgi:preprotein translocase subunit SecE